MSETKQTVITGDMIIQEVVDKYPASTEIMGSYGLSCMGCHANPYETIEAGAAGHGMTAEQIKSMIKELNEVSGKPVNEAPKKEEGVVPLVLTEIAVDKIKSIMEAQKKDGGLRVGAKAGGCAGFTYIMDFEKAPKENDKVIDINGLRVFVDPQSFKALSGVEIDYLETLTESGFKFNNPNANSTCGCGKSFS